MSEMALTAEHLIVIGRGELIADIGVQELVRGASTASVRVRSPQARVLAEALAGPQVKIKTIEPTLIEVRGVEVEKIGLTASAQGVVLYELVPQQASLEDAFMELTGESVEYHADPVQLADSRPRAAA
jgi:ABC-2 type transport system ATP-binding protein